jgi:hypothetical protein
VSSKIDALLNGAAEVTTASLLEGMAVLQWWKMN